MYGSEARLNGWTELSVLLTTLSIVMYHVTNIKHPSLPMTPWVSALVASGLIITGVIYTIGSLIQYNLRVAYELENSTGEINVIHESNYVIMYNVIGAIVVILQLVVCGYIIKDSYERTVKSR